MSYQSSGPSKPQPIPGAQATSPPPRRQSFFDWAMSFGSPGASGNTRPSSDLIEQAQKIKQSRSASFGGSSGSESMGIASSPKLACSKPRILAQSPITHDEALNLSRAGASNSAMSSGVAGASNNGSSKSHPKKVKSKKRDSVSQHHRRSSKGNYEGLGLVAAFSGGPSSF